jgi:DNA-binding XRE family transcriptional regulator
MANLSAASPDDDLTGLALRVRAVRERLGRTQAEFADAVGVSRSFLSEMESGRSKPSTQLVLGIAKAFPEIDRDWLLSGNGQMAIWDTDYDQQMPFKGRMRFDDDTPLKNADPDALRCAVRLLDQIDSQFPGKIKRNRQSDVIVMLYVTYVAAYHDARNEGHGNDRGAYASQVCAEWAAKLAALAAPTEEQASDQPEREGAPDDPEQ